MLNDANKAENAKTTQSLRVFLDALLNRATGLNTRLGYHRHVALAITGMERGREWLGRTLDFYDIDYPYDKSFNKENPQVQPATDKAPADDYVPDNEPLRECINFRQELSKAIDLLSELRTQIPTTPLKKGLQLSEILGVVLQHLNEATMSFGNEVAHLDRASKGFHTTQLRPGPAGTIGGPGITGLIRQQNEYESPKTDSSPPSSGESATTATTTNGELATSTSATSTAGPTAGQPSSTPTSESFSPNLSASDDEWSNPANPSLVPNSSPDDLPSLSEPPTSTKKSDSTSAFQDPFSKDASLASSQQTDNSLADVSSPASSTPAPTSDRISATAADSTPSSAAGLNTATPSMGSAPFSLPTSSPSGDPSQEPTPTSFGKSGAPAATSPAVTPSTASTKSTSSTDKPAASSVPKKKAVAKKSVAKTELDDINKSVGSSPIE